MSKTASEEWICKCLGNKFHVPKNKLVFASISDGFLFSAFDNTRMQANERSAKCRYIWSRCIACAHSLKQRHTENILIEFIWKANIQLQKQLIPPVTALLARWLVHSRKPLGFGQVWHYANIRWVWVSVCVCDEWLNWGKMAWCKTTQKQNRRCKLKISSTKREKTATQKQRHMQLIHKKRI